MGSLAVRSGDRFSDLDRRGSSGRSKASSLAMPQTRSKAQPPRGPEVGQRVGTRSAPPRSQWWSRSRSSCSPTSATPSRVTSRSRRMTSRREHWDSSSSSNGRERHAFSSFGSATEILARVRFPPPPSIPLPASAPAFTRRRRAGLDCWSGWSYARARARRGDAPVCAARARGCGIRAAARVNGLEHAQPDVGHDRGRPPVGAGVRQRLGPDLRCHALDVRRGRRRLAGDLFAPGRGATSTRRRSTTHGTRTTASTRRPAARTSRSPRPAVR